MENHVENSNGISVVVCCYNSAARLPETLEHLAHQRVRASIPWEVVVVNNASSDDTATVALRLWRAAGAPAPLRVVDEPTPGLSHARARGIADSRYEVLVFVDDDNWLDKEYVRAAHEILSEHPEIGVLGGEITAAFESEPPKWFHRVQSVFAVGPQGKASGDITDYKLHVAGAGMAVRKSVHAELKRRQFQFSLSDRNQKQLSSGGDTELCLAAVLLGYRIWYDARLRLTHLMPSQRLTEKYLRRLVRGNHEAGPVLACYEAAVHGANASALCVYLANLRKHLWWSTKCLIKLLLRRECVLLFKLECAGLLRSITCLPALLRAFREHYPAILRLKEDAQP